MKFNYYQIINKINKKVYIGITEKECEERWKKHISLLNNKKHFNDLLQKDWDYYGSNNFEFKKIDELDGDLESGYRKEYELIQQYSGEKYNIAPGGMVNPMYSKVIRQKMIKTKQSQVPNIFQLEEIEENVFKVINQFNSQKEAGKLTEADQGNINHALNKHTKGCGYYWIDGNMLKTFEEEWKPTRTKFTPCAELNEKGEIIKVHSNFVLFEQDYNLCKTAVANAIRRNGKANGHKIVKITPEEYYKYKPITLIF